MNPKKSGVLAGKKILVVEDTDSNYELIRVNLLSIGAIIERAIFGEDAVKMIAGSQKFDLIIMDTKLPGMDGYETTRKIRELDKDIPIIANTAYAFAGEEKKALRAGSTAYLPKPTLKEDLIETITNLLSE